MSAAQDKAAPARKAGRIRDARGGKVTQLDPIALYLLHRHDVIDGDALRAIAHQPGVRIPSKERLALIVGVLALLLVAGLLAYSIISRDFGSAPLARTASLLWFCAIPWVIWNRLKRARFAKVAAAMLKHLRCPHCGYDLRLLPADPADGATVCPECGCAWTLTGHRPEASATPANKVGGAGR